MTNKQIADINKFCQKYQVEAKQTTPRRIARWKPYALYDNLTDIPTVSTEIVDYVQLTMTQRSLECLVESEHTLAELNDELNSIEREERAERNIRLNNASVAKAYKQYRLLLNLARGNYE